MRTLILGTLAAMSLSACHGARCADRGPAALTVEKAEAMVDAAESLALNAVYTRYPTRALVESSETVKVSDDPAVFESHIEMTGSPDTRAIYDVEVTAEAVGEMAVTGFNKVQ